MAARQRSDVEIEVHLADTPEGDVKWKYILGFKHSGGGFRKNEAVIVKERVWSGDTGQWILQRTTSSSEEDAESIKFTHLEQITVNKKFRQIYNYFNSIQYLQILPQLVRDVHSYVLAQNKEDFFGRNLLERMAITPAQTRASYLKKINEVLKVAVPQLEKLEFVKDEVGVPHLEARYIHWRARAAKQGEDQFSDGTLRLIGFMWALLDGMGPVFLEEPELYLHAGIVRQLPEFISNLQRRRIGTRQVVITTHSYDLLNHPGIGGEEVVVLEPSVEGTTATLATDIKKVKKMLTAGLSVAESVIAEVSPDNIEDLVQLSIWD